MAELADRQWELEGYVFGPGTDIEVEKFVPGRGSWRTQDKDRVRDHGSRPGRDRRGSGTWEFDLFTAAHVQELADAQAVAEALACVWPTEELIDTPGAMTPLRYRLGDRTRRIYGRPRNWDASPTTGIYQGLLQITADFSMMDPLFYDDREQSIPFNFVPVPPGGGVISPVVSPVTTTYSEAPAVVRSIDVGGTQATWLTLEFEGPTRNPWVEIDNWRAQPMMTLLYDEKVTLDSRPASRGAVNANGGGIPVSRGTRLAQMRVLPGRHAVRFGSEDGQSSGGVTVRWRDAYREL